MLSTRTNVAVVARFARPITLLAGLTAAFLVDGFTLGPFEPEVAWALFVPFFVYMAVFNGGAEEPGWRGFALSHH